MKTLIALATLIATTAMASEAIAPYLASISVTVRAQAGYRKAEGSGTLFKRKVGTNDVYFCFTAGHVIEHLRSVRDVIVDGKPVKKVSFADPSLVRKLRNPKTGRIVGEVVVSARVIKFSKGDDEDLAILRVMADKLGANKGLKFRSATAGLVPLGTTLTHCGSLLGSDGANSITTGILSQHGRLIGKVDFCQSTGVAFPGSSGGGVCTSKDGLYMGMLVRGTSVQGFNLLVPVQRMYAWCKRNKIEWAMDASRKVTEAEIAKVAVEDSGFKGGATIDKKLYPYLIRTTNENGGE